MHLSSDEPELTATGGSEAVVASRPRSWEVLAVLLISAVCAILALIVLNRMESCPWSDVCGPLLAEDVSQGRLDTALPAPQAGIYLEQTFVPRRDGLSEIELILVRYGEESAQEQENGSFTIELRDVSGAWVAGETLPVPSLSHNQTYTLVFTPQQNSAGHPYVLRLSGTESNPVAAWGYSMDVYPAGELRVIAGQQGEDAPQTNARELRFVTRYALTAGDTVASALAPLSEWRLWLTALLFLPLPGVILLLWIGARGWDAAAWWGAALALGIAAWPIIWYWVSLAGGRWSGTLLWAAVGAGWIVVVLTVARRRSTGRVTIDEVRVTRTDVAGGRFRPVVITNVLLAVLLCATLASRFVAVRDQAYPPWVDSSRHALITAVMVENGRTPANYKPYLPVDHFPYHFGFHSLSASLALMTGAELPELLLYLMQFLGGLLPLAVYAAGWMVTRRRAVGLLAAFLVALPFFFPGYYATWGRMTQLAAMAVMPVLLGLTWRLGRGWPRVWPLVGVLAGGMFLIHFRVFLFYLPFALLVAIAHLVRYRRILGLVKAAALGVLLVLPRIVELISVTNPLQTFRRSLEGYNDFPIGYITTGWERLYLGLTAVAVVVVVMGTVLRRRWVTFPLVLVLWVGALLALLSGERLGLPETLVVNLNSMYITLFLPLALLLAIVAGRVSEWGERQLLHARRASYIRGSLALMAGIALGLMALFGWRQQINILNQQTILAVPDDTPALAWLGDNLPDEARIAVNAWQWLGETWAGSDGGSWIVPLTALETTTPPVDHIYNRDLFAEVRAFNEAAVAVDDWGEPAAASWLVEHGVTHVFIGQRGGYFDPAELNRNPEMELVYQNGGTFVFAIK